MNNGLTSKDTTNIAPVNYVNYNNSYVTVAVVK